MLPTPLYDLTNFPTVYEPSEDTFLFLDALETDIELLRSLKPVRLVEVGSGSGVVVTFLGTTLKDCLFFTTDVNPMACLATKKTGSLNKIPVECLNMDLLSSFKHSLFDVILFNPPYVVTEGTEIVGKGLNRAWAGGKDGREIIDKFLPNLGNFLSDKGVCYMVVIKENKPEEIKEIMSNLGFKTTIVKERKILDLIDSDEYDSDDNSVLSWISKTSTPKATPQEYMILPYNKATTSRSKKSVEDCAKEGAAIGAGLFVLGKMIYDSFNENEESEKNQRQRSQKY